MVVEANQYVRLGELPYGAVATEPGDVSVVTMHGVRTPLKLGDWVIAEPGGEGFYPCAPSVFDAKYEPARGAVFPAGFEVTVDIPAGALESANRLSDKIIDVALRSLERGMKEEGAKVSFDRPMRMTMMVVFGELPE